MSPADSSSAATAPSRASTKKEKRCTPRSHSYWNITSDYVTAIALIDIDEDDNFELVVGCEDGQVLVFKDEAILYELDTSAPVTHLASFGVRHFAFALRNASFGVYSRNQLLWKDKYKEQVVGLCAVFNNNNIQDIGLVVGYKDGSVQVRHHATGNTLHTLELEGSLAAIFRSNYVKINKDQIMTVRKDGRVNGFNPSWDFQDKQKLPKQASFIEDGSQLAEKLR